MKKRFGGYIYTDNLKRKYQQPDRPFIDFSSWRDFTRSDVGRFVDAKGFGDMFDMTGPRSIVAPFAKHYGYGKDDGKDMALDAAAIVNPAADFIHAGTKYDEGEYTDAALYATFGILPFTAGPLVRGTKNNIIKPIKEFFSSPNPLNPKNITKELKNYNKQGVFNSIKDGGLSDKQIKILSKNENLANTVVQNAVKNSDKVTVYRGVNVQNALNNPTAVKVLKKDGVDITNHSDVADWLSTRVHIGTASSDASALSSALGRSVNGGIGYRAGGGGSEHFKYGDWTYTTSRENLLRTNGIESQARDYGPWVNKMRIKGTDDLIDFSSGNRKEWVTRLDDYKPWEVNIKPYGMSNKVGGKVDETIDNMPFLKKGDVPTIDPMYPFTTFDPNMVFNPALKSTRGAGSNMFFGPRGKQIFESWGTPVLNPTKIGGGGGSNVIHRKGGHITSNLKRI